MSPSIDPAGIADTASLLAALVFAVAATAWAVPTPQRAAWVQRHLLGVTAGAGFAVTAAAMGGPGWLHVCVFAAAAVCGADAAAVVAQHWPQRAQLVAAYAASYRSR
ncbi:MAG: hypothetical protein L0H59_11005 [Tomitella sp.]|nr:hypothetical protein [Tomitella sp.]